MTRRAYWLAVLFSVLASFSYLLWGWHDTTMADFWSPSSSYRQQTHADHVAAVGYAFARVVLTLWLLELVPKRKDARE